MRISGDLEQNLKFVFKLTTVAISIQAYGAHNKELAIWILLAGLFLEM